MSLEQRFLFHLQDALLDNVAVQLYLPQSNYDAVRARNPNVS